MTKDALQGTNSMSKDVSQGTNSTPKDMLRETNRTSTDALPGINSTSKESLQTEYFVRELLAWYSTYKRDLPWRQTSDPYRIWVSEIMLQQTRVDTVIPYYERFMEKFPTLEALANAPEEEVLKSWEGLGYYSRVRNLQEAVQEVKEKYNSEVPRDPETIRTLKGVGPYTAGAVLSIAYNVPEPAVDGNVMRVLSRYFLLEDDITKQRTRVGMEQRIRKMIPEGEAGDFNQALMELGALVCTPRSPLCLTCPVMIHCEGRLAGKEEQLPIKKKAKPPRREHRLVALVEGTGPNEGKLLLRQRPNQGLLAGMWELPHLKTTPFQKLADPAAKLSQWLTESFNEEHRMKDWYMDTKHIFSHIHWELRVYISSVSEPSGSAKLPAGWRWVHRDELTRLTLPTVFNNILKERGWI